jgi:CTP synthase (UTP-ammonia lyase)
VLNIENASHEETNPQASTLIIKKLSCSLIGETQSMHVIPATIAYKAYGRDSIIERFQCNYGLNERYRNDLNDGKFKITGFDEDNKARIIEIPNHRFFVATLFLPQFTSKPGMSHPLILSFVKAAIKFRDMEEQE